MILWPEVAWNKKYHSGRKHKDRTYINMNNNRSLYLRPERNALQHAQHSTSGMDEFTHASNCQPVWPDARLSTTTLQAPQQILPLLLCLLALLAACAQHAVWIIRTHDIIRVVAWCNNMPRVYLLQRVVYTMCDVWYEQVYTSTWYARSMISTRTVRKRRIHHPAVFVRIQMT